LKTSDKTIEQTVIISSQDTFGRYYFNKEQIYGGKIGKSFALNILRRLDIEKAHNCLKTFFSKHVFHLEMQMPYL